MPATIAQSLCGAKPAVARSQARKGAAVPGAGIAAAATKGGSAKLFGNAFLEGQSIAASSVATFTASRDAGARRGKVSRVVKVAASDEQPAFAAWNSGSSVKKRTDLKKIMILGAGPIVIGQVRMQGLFDTSAPLA